MRDWVRSAAVFGLALFCLGRFSPVAAQEAPLISEIRVQGNEVTEEFLIRSVCGLNEEQRLLPEDTGRAIRNLYKLGMFSDVRVYMDSEVKGGGVLVVIEVKEYPKLARAEFDGNKSIKDKKLKKELGLIEGQFLSPHEEKRSINKILELYQEDGYLLATVDAERGEPDEEGRIPLNFQIHEGRKVSLKRIQFFENEAFSDSQLRKQMKETKQDGWWFGGGKYDEEKYLEDKALVEEFYRQSGYRDAEIVSDSLYYDGSMEKLYLDITVKEGPLYRFGEVTWEGNEQIPDEGMAELIVVEEDNVYNSERVAKSHEQLSSAYGDMGYIGSRIEPRETPAEDHTVDLHFRVVENDPWKIRQVVITGNSKTKDRVIRRELWIRPGQVFRRSYIERSVREVQQLNYFNNVDVVPKETGNEAELDLQFKVEEKSTGTASVGAGFSERDKLVGTVGLQIPNFLGNGQQLDFQWEFGTRRETFRIGFTEPWLFNTPTSISGSLFRDTQRYFTDFDQRVQGGAIRVGRRLRWPDFSRVSVGYRIEDVSFINLAESVLNDPLQMASLRDNVTSSVNVNFTRDSRDLPLFATNGSVFSYTPTVAGGVLGGNTNFHKHDFSTSFYFPIVWKFALGIKSQLGAVAGYGGDSRVPFNELYTPGGVDVFDGTMIRGYVDQSVGPRNPSTGSALGGRAQLLFNVEMSIPIVQNQFYGLMFADAGNAWESPREISMFDVRRSLGFGIRIIAPVVGIMGFDFAWGIDRREVDGQSPQMMTHFQFGPQFF